MRILPDARGKGWIDFELLGLERERIRTSKRRYPAPVKLGNQEFLLQGYGSPSRTRTGNPAVRGVEGLEIVWRPPRPVSFSKKRGSHGFAAFTLFVTTCLSGTPFECPLSGLLQILPTGRTKRQIRLFTSTGDIRQPPFLLRGDCGCAP